jgi:hypothetical protein
MGLITGFLPEEVRKVLHDHCWSLRNRIRAADDLSQPCPPGRWRWGDVRTDGYGRKTEEELAADRDRNRALAAALRQELAVIEGYLGKGA